MTLYIQPYPYRNMSRRLAAWNRDVTCQQSLRVNVHDEEDALVLKALVPGLKAEDLTIQVSTARRAGLTSPPRVKTSNIC